jgi:putative SOS response-associated peptidase YedK
MCNRYLNDIRKAGLERRYYGFEEFSETPQDIFPGLLAPVIAMGPNGPEWTAMRWGFPPPPNAAGGRPVTNVRNLTSPYWRLWLSPHYRCLVPFTRFAEYDDHSPKGAKRLCWFELEGGRMGFFAGIWRPFEGTLGTKSKPLTGAHRLFAFLTCPPNKVVAPIHAKAMPVILPTREAEDAWLEVPAASVPMLAQPLAESAMRLAA